MSAVGKLKINGTSWQGPSGALQKLRARAAAGQWRKLPTINRQTQIHGYKLPAVISAIARPLAASAHTGNAPPAQALRLLAVPR